MNSAGPLFLSCGIGGDHSVVSVGSWICWKLQDDLGCVLGTLVGSSEGILNWYCPLACPHMLVSEGSGFPETADFQRKEVEGAGLTDIET